MFDFNPEPKPDLAPAAEAKPVPETKPASRQWFLSLRTKLLVGYTVVFSAVFGGAYYWFYDYSTERAMKRIEQDLTDTLAGAVNGINGDTFEALVTEVPAPEDQPYPEDERFWALIDWLKVVHSLEPRASAYTFIAGSEPGELLWVADSFTFLRPADQVSYLESYTNPESRITLGLQELTLSMEPYTDPWGYWVSAYTPLRNSEGEIIGGIGMDFQANYVYEIQEGIQDSMLSSFLITYGSLSVLLFFVSGVLTKPLNTLQNVAEQIGRGEYGEGKVRLQSFIHAKLKDELSSLAEVFALMVGKVEEREAGLKQQIVELKIEIDEKKRNLQVSEIVESDFFSDLKAKAKIMRDNRA
ncbi:MAG: hypothetical protein ACFCU9_16145 [Cyanophyceae cyanobacterium]